MKKAKREYRIESMMPDEYRDGGKALVISYSTFKTGFGICLVASTDKGVCNVLFGDSVAEVLVDLQSRWPGAKLVKKSVPMHEAVRAYFDGGKVPAIRLHLRGTDFQIRVWKALLGTAAGSLTTYREIAERLGDPKLARAVGTAVGQNPIGHIIPCHRVLRSDGGIGGYRWGIERKRVMLGEEGLATGLC